MSITKPVAYNKKLLVEAKIRNVKLKKNALDIVDVVRESKTDPKFKTELCKSWVETAFCIYGNKCRFAHGKSEIFEKPVNQTKYKQKNCLSFFQYGFCNYGTRCHFKHDERTLSDINLPHYNNKLLISNYSLSLNIDKNSITTPNKNESKRLSIFKELTKEPKENNIPNHINYYSNISDTFIKVKIDSKSLSSESQIKNHNDFALNTRSLTHFY